MRRFLESGRVLSDQGGGVMKLLLAALLVLTACANGSSTDGSSGASAKPHSDSSISGEFDVGEGKKLHIECTGSKGPTIVIDVGNDDTVAGSWGEVYEPMKSIGRVCAYDRANLGLSDIDPGPRTIKDLGNDLVKLLHLAKVPGPYVFVGGSFGGNIVGLLAANHPDEVAGLVFVDSDPANDDPKLDPFKKNLPAKTYKECCAPENFTPSFDDPENSEHIDWKGGLADELASVHHQPKVPTVVLSAANLDCEVDWPCKAITKDDIRLQALWIKGNPLGSQKVVESGHVMQREAPSAIVDATKTVVSAVRSKH
jgi:pimeloyl-ACP methyl ester carboxylesterase